MNRKIIPFLIFAMAGALVGLVAVQMFWINEAMKMKAEEFERNVMQALLSTNYALEAREAGRLMASRVDRKQLVQKLDLLNGPAFYTFDTIDVMHADADRPSKKILRKSPYVGKSAPLAANRDSLFQFKYDEFGEPSRMPFPTSESGKLFFYRPFESPISNMFNIELNMDSVLNAVIKQAESLELQLSRDFSDVQVRRIFPDESTDVLARMHPLEHQVGNKNNSPNKKQESIPRKKIKQQIVQRKLRIDSLLNKVAVDFIVPKQPIEERIHQLEFDSILKANLANHGLNGGMEYRVVRQNADSLIWVFGTGKGEDAWNVSEGYQVFHARLFPNDLYNLNERLEIYFPHPAKFVLGKLWSMLLVSFFLIITLVIIFYTSIRVLLRQKKLSDMKSDFINNMTHEFKTPIATINLAADAIANPKVQSDGSLISKYIGIIKSENRRMNIQVEQVLQTAQLDRKEVQLQKSRIELTPIIEHAVELMQIQFDNRGSKVLLTLDSSGLQIEGDEMHLANVFTNLLDNALKYSKETLEVTISCKKSGNYAIISVQDKGIGMNKETKQRIFEKFYRVSTGNVHNIKGFGLGLSYVKAIVEAHNGEVSVETESGVGSTFHIKLPLI
jgi:two-component system, OmpR family, phosphate regulon sensor histidine kinase PhoR